jgi:hypothetical protein
MAVRNPYKGERKMPRSSPPIMRARRRSALPARWGIALAACLAMLGARPAVAQASAYGYAYWGGFPITVKGQTIKVPAGQLFGAAEGKGLRMTAVGGDFITYTASICNWHIDVDFLGRDGRQYDKIQGPDHRSCDPWGVEKWNVAGRRIREGRVCIRLYTHFTHRVASVCHSVHA